MPKWKKFSAERHANFDWSVASDLHFLEFAALKERCRRHVRSSRARQNNADFARLVVANLKPVARVPAELGEKRTCFELFASTGFWETRHKDDLVTVVSNILKRLMMPFDGRDAVPPLAQVREVEEHSVAEEDVVTAPITVKGRQAVPASKAGHHGVANGAQTPGRSTARGRPTGWG